MKATAWIKVPERGRSQYLEPDLWSKLDTSSDFWQLDAHKRIRVLKRGPNRVQLEGFAYVGQAQIGDVRLEITEKISGALQSLLKFATHNTFRIENAPAPMSEMGELAALLFSQFLYAVRRYVSEGRDFQYSVQSCVGSLLGGRINITKTLSLRARGLSHLASFDRNAIKRNTLKNRVVLAALREAENLSALIGLNQNDVDTARGLSTLFDDCLDREVVFGERESMAYLAQRLAEESDDVQHKDVLMLANVLLSHASFEQSRGLPGTVPRAWFLNLETLFQTAIRRVLQTICATSTEVGSGSPRPAIFSNEKHKHRASPDLVLRHRGAVIAIGDVKYKDLTKKVKPADLYQLLVHAAAFNASQCFLVYPANMINIRYLGKSVTGCETWIFGIEINNLPDSLYEAADAMGLPLAVA